MHIAKFTTGSTWQILAHILRLREDGHYGNKNIDAERKDDNYIASGLKHDGSVYLIKPFDKTLEFWKSKQKRAVRKDAITLASIVVTLPERYKELPYEKQKAMLSTAARGLVEALGYFDTDAKMSNIVYSALHFDETTPHLHFGFIPVIDDDMGKPHISFKDAVPRRVYKNLHRLVDLHLEQNCPDYNGGILLSDEERSRKYSVNNQKDAINVQNTLKSKGQKLKQVHASLKSEKHEVEQLRDALASDAAVTLIGKLYDQLKQNMLVPKFDKLTPEESVILKEACRSADIPLPSYLEGGRSR